MNKNSTPVQVAQREKANAARYRAPRWARNTARGVLALFTALQLLVGAGPGGQWGMWVASAHAQVPPTGALNAIPIADPRAPLAFQPSVQMLQGGAALVNITTPNAAGVSLNQFQRFDVPSSGVVLNNSLVGGAPLLGGPVVANPNLSAGRTANTIVNEVTVAGPAGRIGGTVEVFGNPASVIIANPNGITCDGCGVVNTPHFTLSTGSVQWRDANGAPSAFAQATQPRFVVAGGQIDVLGTGIEGTVGQLDLIGETLFIDGPLRAHYLNRGISSIQLTAGRQGDADIGKNGLPTSAAPLGQRGIAIDATALGAMTAGQIRIISTEEGMGVNLRGAVLAYQEDVTVQSAGNLQAAGVSAARNIQLDGSGRITVAGEVTAHGQLQANGTAGAQFDGPVRVQGNVQLQSRAGDVAVTDKLLVGGNLDALAGGQVLLGSAQSVIEVVGTATLKGQDVRQDGRLSVARDLMIEGGRSAGLYGTTLVGQQLDLRARDSAMLAGQLQVNESATIAADSVTASGQTAVSRNLTVAGGRSIEMGGATLVGQELNVDASHVGLHGAIDAGAMNVTGGDVQLGQPGGGLNVNGNLNLNARGPLNAQGTVNIGGSATLASGSDIGFGDTVNIGGNLSLHAGAGVTFGSTVNVVGNAHITAAQGISVASDVTAGGGIGATAGGDIYLSGSSASGAGQQWTAGGNFTSQGGLTGGGVAIAAGNVAVGGDIVGGLVGISARDGIVLGGNVRSGGSVQLNAGAGGVVAQTVQANESIAIRSQGSVDLNQASARVDLDIASLQGDVVTGGSVTSGRNLSVAAQGSAVFNGDMQSGGDVQITGSGVALARGVQAQGAVRLDAGIGGVLSLAGVLANGDVRIVSGGGVDVRGAVASGGSLTLDSAQKIAVTGDLTAGGGLSIQTATELQAQNLRSGGNLRVTAPSARLQSVQATGNAVVQTQDDLHIDGDFIASSIAATSARADIGVGGVIAASGALTLSAGRNITASDVTGGAATGPTGNAATSVQAGGDLHLRSLQVGGSYDAAIGGDHRIDQSVTVQGAASLVAGRDIRVGGSASVGGSLSAQAGGQLAIQGDTLVVQDASIQSGGGQTYGGTARVAGRLDAVAGQGIAVAQELRVNQGISLQANTGAIDIGGPLATMGDLQLVGQQGVRVGGDAQFARGDVVSSAGAIQFGGAVQAGAPLTLQAQSDIAVTGPLVAQAALAAHSISGSIGFGRTVEVAGDADLHAAQNLVFAGNSQWLGQAQLRADTGRIHNQGQMTFAQPVAIDTTGDLVNDGLMQSQGNIAIRARSIDSNRAVAGGIVTAGQLTLQSSAGMALGAQGSWSAAQGIDVQATAGLSTSGTLQAGNNITYSGGILANAGRIVAEHIGVNAALSNSGDMFAQGYLDVSGPASNFGQIAATTVAMGALVNGGQVSGSAVSLGSTSNSGGISGTSVDISGGLDNGGSVSAAGTLFVHGGLVANTGTLNGGSVLLSGTDISNGGRIHADGLLSVSGGSFNNGLTESRICVIANGCTTNGPDTDWRYVQSPGTVDAGSKLTVAVTSMSNKGVVSSGGDVEITGSLSNVRSTNDPLTFAGVSGGGASTGIISAAGNLTVTGASVQNSGGQMNANGAVTIRSSGAFSNSAPAQGVSGQVSGSRLTIDATSITNQGQLIANSGDLSITATAGGIDNTGTLAATGDMKLQASAAVSNGTDGNLLGQNITIAGASFANAGTLYGQGGPAAKVDIQTAGGFSNAASGVVIAGTLLDIGASSYANSGVVGSLADAKLTTPGSYAAASNELIALGKLDLQVNGIQVGVGESWSVGAAEVSWGGTLFNAGSVAIAGSATGNIHNQATGQVQATGMPNVLDGTYQILTAPTGLTDAQVVSYSNVANRAQLFIGGGFNGSLINEASDATVGGGTIEQRPIDQKVIWEGKDANGDTVQVEGDSRAIARLNTGSGAATITLTGPNTGTIVGDAITINGSTIVHQPGIDPATGLPLVQQARSRQVQTTAIAQAPEGQAVQANVKGPVLVTADRPDTQPAPAGGGSGAGNAGAGNVPAGTGGSGVPGEVPPEVVATKPLALPRVDVSTPQGGIGALLGGGASVSLPDWSQLHIVPGGISANDLALNLSGQFINRGQFDVGNNLIIAAAEGIDNFGASIRAGGAMELSGGGLNNEQGRIEAGSLLTSIQGDIANSRGTIEAHNGGYLQADGNIAATDGQFTSDAGKIVLDAGGNIVLDASRVTGKSGAGLYAGGDISLGAKQEVSRQSEQSTTYRTETRQELVGSTGGDADIPIYETRQEQVAQSSERTSTETVRSRGTVVDGGQGDLSIIAGGNFTARGADLKAEGRTSVMAQNIDIAALVDRTSSTSETVVYSYSEQPAARSEQTKETLSGGSIEGGRGVSLIARSEQTGQGNIELTGVRVQGGQGGATVLASGNISAKAIALQQSQSSRQDTLVSYTTSYDNDSQTSPPTTVTYKAGESRQASQSTTHAGTVIDGGEGNTTVRAQGDVVALGAQIKAKQDVLIQGANVRIEALKDSAASHEEEHRHRYDHALSQSQQTLAGGEVSAGRNLSIIANGKDAAGNADTNKGDLTLRGATVTAKGDVSLIASRDIQIQDQQTEHTRFEETYSQRSGFLSKKSTHTIEQGASSLSEGSVVTGNAIYVQAGRDIAVQGSHLVGQSDVGLVAGRDIAIRAGVDSAAATSHTENKKSGLFSGGGFGITLGKQSTTTDHSNESQRAVASSVQSQGGNVALVAGNRYEQEGSVVLAKGDVSIVGKSVDIREARELERDKFETRAKQSGLTVSIGSPIIDLANTAGNVGRAIGRSSDTRTQALGIAAIGLNVYNNAQNLSNAGQALLNGDPTAGASVNISLGSSQSRSTSAYQVDSAAGSQIKADGNVNITATQADLRVRGSDIEAGKDASLTASKGNIVLEAAENRFAEQNSHSSSSGSIGVSIGAGGVSVSASGSRSRGQGNGESVSYINTHIRANGTASVQSAGDTTLSGASIAADKVRADVGGNLVIESLQDSSRYNESSRTSGFGISIPIGAGRVGASVTAGRTQIDSNYQSVGEQSGIRAGDAGFEVNVQGNTDLKGGSITSTQVAIDAGKNSFQTGGTLTMSDLDNRAAYNASGYEVTVGVGSQLGSSGAGVGSDKGNASSTSRAGISGVAGHSEARTGDAETGIKPIFDKNRVSDEVNAQITITREFGKQGSTAWGNYATQQYATALQKGDAEGAECWGPSGTCRAVGHALIGGATGGVGGAVGAGVTSMTAPQAQALLRGSGLPEPMVQALVQGYGMGIGGAVGGDSGAAAGTNEAAHNTATFYKQVLQIVGGVALTACFALPQCTAKDGPQFIAAVQELQRAGEVIDETMLRGCRLVPACMSMAVAMGVDVFGTAPGKPVTPEQGPNHTGGNQTENPTPGGSSTAKPNEGPRGENSTGGNQIADQKPGSNNTVSPIVEPQGPGLVFNEGANDGELTGRPTRIPPSANDTEVRSLIRENQSAEILSKNGFKVEQNPSVEGNKNPDYKINGEVFDNYAPSTGSVRNAAGVIEGKVASGQADNIVVNLADSSITPSGLRDQLTNYPIPGLKQVIIIDKSGKPTVIKLKGK